MTAVLVALALVLGPLEVPPLAEISVAAEATAPAVRLDPPPPPSPPAGYSSDSDNGRCVGAEDLLRFYSPGWDVARMSRIMYRESRCLAEARNSSSSATGLLQLLASHCKWLAAQMDTWCTRDRLNDPHFNVKAAAVLWREQGMSAWAATS